MWLRIFIISLLSFALSWNLHGQGPKDLSTQNKRAKKLYQESGDLMLRRQFPEMIEVLNKALQRDPDFLEAHLRIAYAYRTLLENDKAIHHFQEALRIDPNHARNIETHYVLGESVFYQGKYQEAKSLLRRYLGSGMGRPERIKMTKKLLENCDFALEAIQNPLDFEPKAMESPLNQFQLQYFPALTADENSLIFTRRVGTQSRDDEDMYISHRDSLENWSVPESISDEINTPWNEGTCTITADGNFLIFTSCQGRKSYGSCDLYYSEREGDEWSKPKNLGEKVNSPSWESQPSLSADGRVLYFVSDRPGGFGGKDIWRSIKGLDGKWQEAENLGKGINTSAEELSPYIHVNGRTLYFSSDGYPGMGGLDLFQSELSESGWSKPENLGYPINDHNDQISLVMSANGKTAYYSHEDSRQSMNYTSLLHTFMVPEEIRVSTRSNYITGTVYDADTKKVLAAQIELFDLQKDSLVSSFRSDPINGRYLAVLSEGTEYSVYVQKKGYLFESLSFDYTADEEWKPVVLDIYLKPVKKGTLTTLSNVFFDTDSYALKDKSKTELNEVVRFLKDNSTVKVEISGHTDNVGSKTYNKELSLNRAKSVFQFLHDAGIEKGRLSYVGKGEEEPIADNATELGRSKNRRIEFKLL